MPVTQNYTRSVMAITETENNENNNTNDMATLLEGIDYNLSNRTLVPVSIESDIVVAGDEGSQKIKILVNKFFDGEDLSQKTAQIAFENAKGETEVYTIPRDKEYFDVKDEDKVIVITWKIDSRLTKVEGEIRFQVRFLTITTDDQNRDFYTYLWQSKIQTFKVLPQITIENDATPVDYTEEIAIIKENPSDIYSSLVDEDVTIDIVNREIGQLPREIIIKGDTKSQVITFRLPRQIEGIDIYEKIIAIKYVNANGDGDRSIAVNKQKSSDGNYVTFCWLLGGTATAAVGKLQFAIEILGFINKPEDWQERLLYSEDELKEMSEEEVEKYKQSIADYEEEQTENVYIWQTKIASVNVLNGIEIANYVTEVNKDYLTNWTIRSEGLLQTIESLQNTTLNYKEAAETAQGKAETAQGKAETAQDAAETAQGKAETAQGKAEAAQGKAETAQDAAETAQEASETARDVALGLISTEENNEGAITIAVRNAQTSATQAKINADIAQQLAETANNAKKVVLDLIDDGSKDGEPGAIYLAKEQAIESAGSASDSANVATEAKKAAEAAKGAAETAQGKAEGARDAAEGARDTALGLIDATEGNEGEIILIKKDMEDLKEATDSTYEATAGALEETKEIQAKVEKMQTWFMLVEEF